MSEQTRLLNMFNAEVEKAGNEVVAGFSALSPGQVRPGGQSHISVTTRERVDRRSGLAGPVTFDIFRTYLVWFEGSVMRYGLSTKPKIDVV